MGKLRPSKDSDLLQIPPGFVKAEPLRTHIGLRQVREAKLCSAIIFSDTVSAVYTMSGLPGLSTPDKCVSALV